MTKKIIAFAPATVSNLAVGYDILGFPIEGVGDVVTLEMREDQKLVIQDIIAPVELPKENEKNTATVALSAMLKDLNIDYGFDITIEKGIPLGSGMGGSGASAVGALVAANAFLPKPLTPEQLAVYALQGEAAASGQAHGDNVIPCLMGGLTLIKSINPVEVMQLPHTHLCCVLVHPYLMVETKMAREILKPEQPLENFVKQAANLACFIVSLYENNHDLMKCALKDELIEQHRAPLVKGFVAAQKAALDEGAIGCSLSGSGPSMFSFAEDADHGTVIAKAMIKAFAQTKVKAEYWISNIASEGAKVFHE